jgi:hypothetical protein
LILLSKTQKGHFNLIKISQVKKKKIYGDKVEEKLKAKVKKESKGDKIT